MNPHRTDEKNANARHLRKVSNESPTNKKYVIIEPTKTGIDIPKIP